MSKIEVFDSSDKKIVAADVLLTIIVSTFILSVFADLHLAISIGISIVIGVILLALFQTRIGYIIITFIFSAVWTVVAVAITHWLSKGDNVWKIVVGIFAFLASLGAHMVAKRYYDNVEEL